MIHEAPTCCEKFMELKTADGQGTLFFQCNVCGKYKQD